MNNVDNTKEHNQPFITYCLANGIDFESCLSGDERMILSVCYDKMRQCNNHLPEQSKENYQKGFDLIGDLCKEIDNQIMNKFYLLPVDLQPTLDKTDAMVNFFSINS